MASLHRDPRGKSPYWYCAFTDANGKRFFKSTKETKHQKALAVAQGWQRAAELGRKGLLTQVQALKVVSEIYERTNNEPLNSADTTSFLCEWVASKKLSTAPGTARRYSDVVNAFLKHLGDKANRNLSGLTPRDIATFRDLNVNAGKSNKTANMAVKTLRIALNTGRNQGLILTNPADAVELLPEDSVVRKPFTREQMIDLLTVADEEWRGMILLGAYHGLRIGDAAHLTWANVDTQRRSIRYLPQKRKRSQQKQELEIPMHPDVLDYLLALRVRADKPDAPVFPKLSKKKAKGRTGLSAMFVSLMEKAQIYREPGIKKVSGKGRQVHMLSFHSFRHTAISQMANSGVSKERRMKLSGHKSSVHERYTHHELETLRKDVESVPSLLRAMS
jgi:integrase